VVARFSQPPTLGEIIKRARQLGFTKHAIRDPENGRIVFLRREKKDGHLDLVDLPPGPETQRLTRTVAEGLCKKLGIPLEDFGLGPSDSG